MKDHILNAAGRGDYLSVMDGVCSFISAACGRTINFASYPGYEVIFAFVELNALNMPTKEFPILEKQPKSESSVVWDYMGRSWYMWVNLLAHSYGWTIDCISNLEIDDGLALIQEVLIDEQIQKEWQWSLSEIAYPYNQTTKKSEFKPLPRPPWMTPKVEKIETFQIPAFLMPVGKVIDIGGVREKIENVKH